MAAANGKKGYTFKFELSLTGLLGVVVLCFCIFLWMFLLGLWAGQTGLISGISFSAPPAIPAAAKSGAPKSKVPGAPAVASVPEPEAAPAPPPEPAASAPPPEATGAGVPPEAPSAPAEAAAQAEAPAQPKSATYYSIQVGAFRDPRYVEESLQEWRALGYEPFARPPVGSGEHLTKVYLGRFSEVTTARKEAEALAKKERITPVVVMIPADPPKRP